MPSMRAGWASVPVSGLGSVHSCRMGARLWPRGHVAPATPAARKGLRPRSLLGNDVPWWRVLRPDGASMQSTGRGPPVRLLMDRRSRWWQPGRHGTVPVVTSRPLSPPASVLDRVLGTLFLALWRTLGLVALPFILLHPHARRHAWRVPAPAPGRTWIHGASAGEHRVVEALRAAHGPGAWPTSSSARISGPDRVPRSVGPALRGRRMARAGAALPTRARRVVPMARLARCVSTARNSGHGGACPTKPGNGAAASSGPGVAVAVRRRPGPRPDRDR